MFDERTLWNCPKCGQSWWKKPDACDCEEGDHVVNPKTQDHSKGDWLKYLTKFAAGPWLAWPEEKPKKDGKYLVWLSENDGDDVEPEVDTYRNKKWEYYKSEHIVAWAEINAWKCEQK
jgi:hypothetical protein